MTDQQTAPTILEVVSERFRWTKDGGFVVIEGSDGAHGLNRTHEGALKRIASQVTFTDKHDRRHRAFLAQLIGEEALATIASTYLQFRDGNHVLEGRRFAVREAEIGD